MAARHCQWRVCFSYIQNAQRLSISIRGVWTKRVIGSGAFHKNNETHHWQWRATIRIFEILQFSFLFLIIIIINKN
jgi:hypothetical protein